MFGLKQKKSVEEPTTSGTDLQPDSTQPTVQAPESPGASVDIYTLPEKFLPTAKVKKGKQAGNNNKVTIMLLIALGVVVVGGVGAFLYFRSQAPAEEVVIPNVNIAPLHEQPEEQEPEEEPVLVVETPDPISYTARDTDGNAVGTLTLELAAEDVDRVDDISITSSDGEADPLVFGAIFRLVPSGLSLSGTGKLTIEYFDTELTSVTENSLRIGFEQSLGDWQVEQSSSVNVTENAVTLSLRQIPRTRIALVSNLSDVSFGAEEEEDDDIDPTSLEQQELVSGLDSDGDGLSDVEEELYSTDPNLPDTDQDGFLDGSEVENLYSPLTPATLLEDSPLFTKYTNDVYNYSVLYPSSWTIAVVDGIGAVVLFSSPTSQFTQVVIEEREPETTSIVDWYIDQVPGLTAAGVEQLTLGEQNTPAVRSLDGTTVYFLSGDYVVAISYNLGIEQQADYLTTWEAMQHSWSAIPEVIAEPEPEDEDAGESTDDGDAE